MERAGQGTPTLAWLALMGCVAYVLLVLSVTLYPFDFSLDAASVRAGWRQIEWEWIHRDGRGRLRLTRDLAQNLMLLAPLGALWAAWRGIGKARPGWCLVAEAAAAGCITSGLVEALQLLLPMRWTQLADVTANTLGAAGGGVLAALGVFLLRAFATRRARRTGRSG